MKKEPNFFYRDTRSVLEKSIVHINNDEALEHIMKGGRQALYELTDRIFEEHKARFGEPLQITRKSLACEIKNHYRVYKLVKKMPEAVKKTALAKRALLSTEVIDCGEKAEDGNRFVWDFLSVFQRR